jgi:RNA polymerase sigma-70 factor (ECF subfamily)
MAADPGAERDRPGDGPLSPEATVDLLDRVKQGDREALDRLLVRLVPMLRRWAHGRLPHSARSTQDTADLVQDTIISAVKKLDGFELRHQGALQAYLRQSVLNRIRDVARYNDRRPGQTEIPAQLADAAASPLEQAIDAENTERYERALQRLPAADREAIIGRLELQYSYDELAVSLNKATAAARGWRSPRHETARRGDAACLRHSSAPSQAWPIASRSTGTRSIARSSTTKIASS